MKKSRYTEAQVTYALRQAEAGTPVSDVCRGLGISEATFYNWRKKYGDLAASEIRRLRQLEEENARLKRVVADLTLDKHILQDVIRKKVCAVVRGKAVPMASVGLFRPSTTAIRMSWHPRVLSSLNTLSQNLTPLGLLDPQAQYVALAVGLHAQRQVHRLAVALTVVADLDPQRVEEHHRVHRLQRQGLPGNRLDPDLAGRHRSLDQMVQQFGWNFRQRPTGSRLSGCCASLLHRHIHAL